jgi:hypothetical protein
MGRRATRHLPPPHQHRGAVDHHLRRNQPGTAQPQGDSRPRHAIL